jgi:acyl-CoA dehydrogenase
MTGQTIHLDPVEMPPEAEAMRAKVRAFLARERAADGFVPGDLMRHSPDFSRRCAAEGFIGMTWPKEFGGGGLSYLERHVMTEELLAAGAPVWAHWVAAGRAGRC